MSKINVFEIKQESGKNLRKVISGLLVKSPIEPIKEFVSNSYDADSEKVSVDIDYKLKTIVIEDDGYGMDENGLTKFIRMGDSEKKDNPVSPKGRKLIGKFGIANTLLQYLGEEYILETWKDDIYIRGFERFNDDTGGNLEYIINENTQKRNGTRITIKGLKFDDERRLNLSRLRDSLTWEIPNSEDFQVILNGELLIRENPTPIKIAKYSTNLKNAGFVEMSVNIYDSPVRINGTYIYVNSRAVGDPRDFDKTLRGTYKKMHASVIADQLNDFISFDRSKFLEDNPAYFELKNWINECLRKVRNDIEGPRKRLKRIKATSEDIKEALLGYPLNIDEETQNIKNNNHKPYKKRKNKEINIKTCNNPNSSVAAYYDDKSSEFIYNLDHPLFKSLEITSPEILKMQILLGTSLGLSQRDYSRDNGSNEFLEKFNRLTSKLLSTDDVIDSIESRINTEEKYKFSSTRGYTQMDIFREGIAHYPTIRTLIKAGVFHPENDKIPGKEINDYIVKSTNHTPAIEVVQEWGKQKINVNNVSRQAIDQRMKKIDKVLTHYKSIIPFIYDIGVDNPFFLIENESIPAFLGLYSKGFFIGFGKHHEYYFDKHLEEYEKLLKNVLNNNDSERFVGIETLCDVVRDSPIKVFKVIGYSLKKGIEMPFRDNGENITYSLSRFKKAYQNYMLGVNDE